MLMRSKQIISHSFDKRCETPGKLNLIYLVQNCNAGSFYSDESWFRIFLGRYVDSLVATNRPRCEMLNQQFHQIRALKPGEAAALTSVNSTAIFQAEFEGREFLTHTNTPVNSSGFS